MAKFRFRLATLQKIREATRDERRNELAQAYRADAILEEQQNRLQRDVEAVAEHTRQASKPGHIDINTVLGARRYEVAIRAQQRDLAQKREQIQEEIERRRERLIEADREVKVLEKLEEKQRERFVEEEQRRDMKALDEAASRVTREEPEP